MLRQRASFLTIRMIRVESIKKEEEEENDEEEEEITITT